jgi:GNAT superfamily N-acetyltransferase
MLLPAPELLDRLADRGWPALETEGLGGWTLRASEGVTNRANSVLAGAQPIGLPEAISRAEAWYAARGLPTVFQVSPASPAGLAEALDQRGYHEHSATDILVAERVAVVGEVLGAGGVPRGIAPRIEISDAPPHGWLDTWWEVDGRGGVRERGVVARILVGGPALYAWSGAAAAPDAVARLALVGEWGGLYAVATLPRARRRGLARALARALAVAAVDCGVERLWLQVLADNVAAQALYAELGFVRASGYCYWEQVRLARLG